MNRLTLFLLIITSVAFHQSDIHSFDEEVIATPLMRDLLIVSYLDNKSSERFPVTYNHLLQGGYFNMPSARMGIAGEMGGGYSYVHPYSNYNARCQLLSFFEISGNYRIFHGIKDPTLTQYGFGDMSDKGANFKCSLFQAEDSRYQLPGLAFGMEDFLGTRNFKSSYIVLTQVFSNYNMEVSLGYGRQRIRGLFGGFLWMPFRHNSSIYLKDISFGLEYDATPYWDSDIEKHDKGRKSKTPWNIGIKYRLWDSIDLSLSYVRGMKLACSASMSYNFGTTKGIIPKINLTPPYQSPIITEEIGFLRPEESLIYDFIYAFRDQGFDIFGMWLSDTKQGEKILRLQVFNSIYREEHYVRERLNALLVALTPDNVDLVIVVMDCEGFPVQEYRYEMKYVREYAISEIGIYELSLLTPITEVSCFDPSSSRMLFWKERELCEILLLPKTYTLFGSSKGKFKYAFGVSALVEGYLPYKMFYTLKLGYFLLSNLYDIHDADRLNPSQLINVRTDIINYYKSKSITIDQAYIQKVTNWGKGCYTRSALGYFEQEYGGVALEWLYYPVNSALAVGLEGAVVKKRTTEELFSFTDKIRKLDRFKPTYRKFLGSQYFLNLYYDWRDYGLDFRVSAGKFLANDHGIQYEISRYFPSGLRLSFWYTYTNGHDRINGHTYYDKGVAFSVPLDIFYSSCSRTRWGYGMSAWLRDVGVKSFTGGSLYEMINESRQ
jgi:hypothetical protein